MGEGLGELMREVEGGLGDGRLSLHRLAALQLSCHAENVGTSSNTLDQIFYLWVSGKR